MLDETEIPKFEGIGPSRFSFNGNIIAEIGEESISNPNIAIAELVKNSYDADAKQVILKVENLGKHNTRIIFMDDGVGMDSDDVKDRWMDIGAPHKKDITRTPIERRVPVGAKGIGRFASHCLGSSLTLLTKKKAETNGYKLVFDWDKYTPTSKATDIDNVATKFKMARSSWGTTLIVDKLKQNWNDQERLKGLLKDLYLLMSPINLPKGFRIRPEITRHCKKIIKINKAFLDKSAYHLSVKLRKSNEITYKFIKNGKTMVEEGKQLQEKLACGNVQFDLYFYYKSRGAWKKWIKKDITGKEMKDIKLALEEYGGIKLYRDKFRVKPYGDKKADWIGLDKWSRDDSMVPGNAQVFGVVSIGKELNPKIQDTTTREGVINNAEFFDLSKFVTTCVRMFVRFRADEEKEKAKAKKSRKRRKKGKIKVELPKVEDAGVALPDIDFIDATGIYPTRHYRQCVYEVNECEKKGYPNAAFWMCRKIVENLVFHILEKKFPRRVDLWFDTRYRRNQTLSVLINNLYQNRGQFQPNALQYIEQFKRDVGKFKKDVNSAIHKNICYLSDKGELGSYKIPKLIQLLLQIYEAI